MINNLFVLIQETLEEVVGEEVVLSNNRDIQLMTLEQQRNKLVQLYPDVVAKVKAESAAKAKPASADSVSKVSAIAAKYTGDQITQIKDILGAITGKADWIVYKSGACMMLNVIDEAASQEIVRKLAAYKGYNPVAGRLKDTASFVVQLNNINLRVLAESTAKLVIKPDIRSNTQNNKNYSVGPTDNRQQVVMTQHRVPSIMPANIL